MQAIFNENLYAKTCETCGINYCIYCKLDYHPGCKCIDYRYTYYPNEVLLFCQVCNENARLSGYYAYCPAHQLCVICNQGFGCNHMLCRDLSITPRY